MPSCEGETGISRCLQAGLHYSGIPPAGVVKVYDLALALSRGSSVDDLLVHALQDHRHRQHDSPTHLDDEYCVILHVQPPHHEFSTKLRCEYTSQLSLLIVQMPPKYPHAEAASKIHAIFTNQITAMGLEEELVGGACAEVSWGNTHIISKTPDCYWRPKGRDVRPTMVIEVEVTPSAQRILGAARTWLSDQDYQPIVVTVQVIPSEQKVIVACWEREGETETETIQQRGQVWAEAQARGNAVGSGGRGFSIPAAAVLGRSSDHDHEQGVFKIDRRDAEKILGVLLDRQAFKEADKRAASPSPATTSLQLER